MKTKMKLKTTTVFFAMLLTIVLTLIPVQEAMADEVTEYPIWIAGVQFTSNNLTINSEDSEDIASGSAAYDPAAKKLTLDNLVCRSKGTGKYEIYYALLMEIDADCEIEFNGTCTIEQTESNYWSYGIGCIRRSFEDESEIKVIINGSDENAVLNARGGVANGNGSSCGIGAHGIDLEFKGGIVDATAGQGQQYSYGLFANGGIITVKDATLTATGGKAVEYSSAGIHLNDTLYVKDGATVTGIGGDAQDSSFGSMTIDIKTSISVDGGQFTLKGKTNAINKNILSLAEGIAALGSTSFEGNDPEEYDPDKIDGYKWISMHKHTWEWGNDENTHWHECTACGEKKDEAAHIEEIDQAVSPTCTETGLTEGKHCSKCELILIEQEPVDATGHKYGAWKKLNATQHQKVCEHDANHIEKENHKWDAGKVTKKATEKATGIKAYTCTVCKATKTETIPKLKAKVSGTPAAKTTAKGKTSLTIGWAKIKGADGYDIFFALCNHGGKEIACKKVKTIKGNKTFTWTKSGLKKGTAYKAYVKAYVMKNGKKSYVRTSPMMHAYTGGQTKNYTNAKSVTVNKTKVSLKKGKTFKIKGKVVKVNKNKKLMPKAHEPTLRYMTSDKKIATVSSKGKIKAVAKGKCYIYAYAHNGVSKKVTVTVKR